MANSVVKTICMLYVLIDLVNAGVGSYFKSPTPEYGSAEWYRMRYELMSTTPRTRTDHKRPDQLFFGFFPLWSAILVGLTCFCLLISLIALICHYTGCRNPRNTYLKEKKVNKALMKQQLEMDFAVEPNDDYVSVTMMDQITADNQSQRLFSSSRLMPQINVPEYDLDASTVYSKYENRTFENKYEKDYEKQRKKRFLKEHL